MDDTNDTNDLDGAGDTGEPADRATVRVLEFGSTDCFACGRNNDHGLHMRFRAEGERLVSDVAVPAHLRGWSNLAHGGILSTMMDEIMAWSAMYFTRRLILTKSMRIEFLRPVRIDTQLSIAGWVKERTAERYVTMEAEIAGPDGLACARAEAQFALFDREHFEKLGILPAEALSELTRMLGI